jgi:hypothetical protein
VQVSVYVAPAVSGPVDREPTAGWLPLQAPDAVQALAWAAFQERVELPPLFTVLGFAPKVMVGAADDTETVTDCVACPPAPVQVRT